MALSPFSKRLGLHAPVLAVYNERSAEGYTDPPRLQHQVASKATRRLQSSARAKSPVDVGRPRGFSVVGEPESLGAPPRVRTAAWMSCRGSWRRSAPTAETPTAGPSRSRGVVRELQYSPGREVEGHQMPFGLVGRTSLAPARGEGPGGRVLDLMPFGLVGWTSLVPARGGTNEDLANRLKASATPSASSCIRGNRHTTFPMLW